MHRKEARYLLRSGNSGLLPGMHQRLVRGKRAVFDTREPFTNRRPFHMV
jgi:hypothetical protein